MKDLTVNVGDKSVTLHLPEKISEISLDYLKAVTKEVVIENNYALVALCVSDRLATLINTKTKDVNVKGIAILVDKNDPANIVKSKPGNKLICSPTDIMRGYEVTSSANILSPGKVAAFVNSDEELRKNVFIKNTGIVWLVTFKLVPLHDIHGSYDDVEMSEADSNAIKQYYE